jgi:hypothetical protein
MFLGGPVSLSFGEYPHVSSGRHHALFQFMRQKLVGSHGESQSRSCSGGRPIRIRPDIVYERSEFTVC